MAEQLDIISWSEAKASGLPRYFTGRPCKAAAHIAERLTANGNCIECSKAALRARYAANPEKHRQRAREWGQQNAARRSVTQKAYRAANTEKRKQAVLRWRGQNADKVRADNRAASKRWRAANPEKRAAAQARWIAENWDKRRQTIRQWRAANPEKANAITRNRRARKLAAEGTHTAADLVAILKNQNHRCVYCRADLRKVRRHVDHIEPLLKGGSNWPANLQFLCMTCNVRKNTKDPIQFAQEQGLLL
jgi:5-methylcytosine-specific restriction endonuclease McrA